MIIPGYLYLKINLFNELSDHSIPIHFGIHVAIFAIGDFVEFVLEIHNLLDIFNEINAVAVKFNRAIVVDSFHNERRLLKYWRKG